MFLYFLVIPFILPFAPSLVKGDGWAAVETEIFILYSQGQLPHQQPRWLHKLHLLKQERS